MSGGAAARCSCERDRPSPRYPDSDYRVVALALVGGIAARRSPSRQGDRAPPGSADASYVFDALAAAKPLR
jgi:hypothetical protein